MPAKGARREKHVAGDKSQPDSLGTLLLQAGLIDMRNAHDR
jgi:hypothetical protein